MTKDKLGDEFSKMLEENGAKVIDCTPTQPTPTQEWEELAVTDDDIRHYAGKWTKRERIFFVAGATCMAEKCKSLLAKERESFMDIVQKEIAKSDKYEIAPLQRIMIKISPELKEE